MIKLALLSFLVLVGLSSSRREDEEKGLRLQQESITALHEELAKHFVTSQDPIVRVKRGSNKKLKKDLKKLKKNTARTVRKMIKKALKVDGNKSLRLAASMIRLKPLPRINPSFESIKVVLNSGDRQQTRMALNQLAQMWSTRVAVESLCTCRLAYCDCCASLSSFGAGCVSIEASLQDQVVDINLYKVNHQKAFLSTTIMERGGEEICATFGKKKNHVCFIPLFRKVLLNGGVEGCFIMKMADTNSSFCLRYLPGRNAALFPVIF